MMKYIVKNRWMSVAVLAGAMLGHPAQAQSPAPAALPASPASGATYRIAPEDALNVTVVNFKDLSIPQVWVTPDGNISVPLLEPVSVAGKTTEQVAQALATKWRKYVVDPAVTVSLVQKHRERVIVSGFVARPGESEYRPSLRLLDAIAQGGDVLPNADLSQVTVTHKDGTTDKVDLTHPERKTNTEANLAMADGDVVYIPEQRAQFSVVGEVNKPGSYTYKIDMTVLDALTAVGGVKDTADLESAKLTRNGQDDKIDLDALLRHGDMTRNVKLAPGDRLVIPEGNRTYVYGAVARAGFYQYRPGDRVLDALNASGGPIQGADYHADLTKVNVVRIDKSKNVAEVQPINLESFLKKGDITGNPVLQPGDVVFVADKTHRQAGESWWTALQGLSLLNVGARILTRGLGH